MIGIWNRTFSAVAEVIRDGVPFTNQSLRVLVLTRPFLVVVNAAFAPALVLASIPNAAVWGAFEVRRVRRALGTGVLEAVAVPAAARRGLLARPLAVKR